MFSTVQMIYWSKKTFKVIDGRNSGTSFGSTILLKNEKKKVIDGTVRGKSYCW